MTPRTGEIAFRKRDDPVPRVTSGIQAHARFSSCYSGRLGNVCQFPGGTGTCTRGVCTLTSCGTGYYLSAGRCVQYDLQTDVNNWYVLLVFPSAVFAHSLTRFVAGVSGESAPFRTGWQPAAVVNVPSLRAPPATPKAVRPAWPSILPPIRGIGEPAIFVLRFAKDTASLTPFAGKQRKTWQRLLLQQRRRNLYRRRLHIHFLLPIRILRRRGSMRQD